ncbi:hypothetical protein [Luteolibacter sp. LG18]|uniref:hypothetical protein n=1 Tax=Luteolibacter sp. LG18 TaxID=2819286 RepID=UPI0030C756F3
MQFHRPFLLSGVCAVALAGALSSCKSEKKDVTSLSSEGAVKDGAKKPEPPRDPAVEKARVAYQDLAKQFKGEDLNNRRIVSLRESVQGLDERQTQQLFDTVLPTADPGVVQAAAYAAVPKLLADPARLSSVEGWILSTGNPVLQDALLKNLGSWFAESGNGGFRELLGGISTNSGKDNLLSGYCLKLAEKDPEAAVKDFIALQRKAADFSELSNIVRRMPDDAPFEKVSALLPGDNKSIAKGIRMVMFEKWAGHAPESAAAFILATKEISPSQMEVVVAKWIEKSKEKAYAWVDAAEPSPARDYATKAFILYTAKTDPKTAWSGCGNVEDAAIRAEAQKAVLEKWKKSDPAAAQAAQKQLQAAQVPPAAPAAPAVPAK